MSDIRLPYVNIYKDRYGKARSCYRRGGLKQMIPGTPGSPEWLADYQKIHAGFQSDRSTNLSKSGTFGRLIEIYYESPEFRELSAKTKYTHRLYLEELRVKLGTIAIFGITKAVIMKWRDKRQDRPSSANFGVKVVRRLFGFAKERDIIKDNPAEAIKPLKIKSDGWEAWPDDSLALFARDSKGSSRIAFFLALYTGQRRSDVLAMRWDAITDGGVAVTQIKTGAEMWIPIHPILQAELDSHLAVQRAGKFSPSTIVAKGNGGAYSDFGFLTIWKREQARLGLVGLQFHGLRRNAVNSLYEAGCTPQEVQSITGHKTLSMVQHYGAGVNQRRMATTAMKKTEKPLAVTNRGEKSD